jgi:hypothetical protein
MHPLKATLCSLPNIELRQLFPKSAPTVWDNLSVNPIKCSLACCVAFLALAVSVSALGDRQITHLPVSPHFRNTTVGIGCVGHDYRPAPRTFATRRAPVLYGTSARISPRRDQSAVKIAKR